MPESSGHGTYPQWDGIPPMGTPGPDRCSAVGALTFDVPGVPIYCQLYPDHPSSHACYLPMHGRRRVDLKPEFGGAGAGSVHMRALVVWDSPDA